MGDGPESHWCCPEDISLEFEKEKLSFLLDNDNGLQSWPVPAKKRAGGTDQTTEATGACDANQNDEPNGKRPSRAAFSDCRYFGRQFDHRSFDVPIGVVPVFPVGSIFVFC